MSAKTTKLHSPIAINIVVEGQLLVLLDSPVCKYAHPDLVADGPFCNITIRITAVVGKPTDTSALSGVDKLGARSSAKKLDGKAAMSDIPHLSAAS